MRSMIKVVVTAFASATLIGASPATTTLTVALTGAAQMNFAHPAGGTGDPDGSGTVWLAIDPANKQVCYDFRLAGLATPMMAHIHQGAPLKNGPPVVTLFTGLNSDLANCVKWTRGQLAAIVANPSDYYVSVDTTEFPDGAVRGQLAAA